MFSDKIGQGFLPHSNKKHSNLSEHVRKNIFRTHKYETQGSSCDFLENLPLKSPFPDYKRANIISPTKSPERNQIQKGLKFSVNFQKNCPRVLQSSHGNSQSFNNTLESPENTKILNTKHTYDYCKVLNFSANKNCYVSPFAIQQSQTLAFDLKKQCKKKDMIITELRKIINMITSNQRQHTQLDRKCMEEDFFKQDSSSFPSQEKRHFEDQIRILTLQNQKLLCIIDKLQVKERQMVHQSKKLAKARKQTRSESIRSQQKDQLVGKLLVQVNELKAQIGELQIQVEQNSFLQKQLKQVLQEKQNLQKKIKNWGDPSESLQIIRQQHERSLLSFKLSVSQEMQSMLDTIQLTFSQINNKLNKVQKKLVSLQQDQQTIIRKHREFYSQICQRQKDENSTMEAVINRQKNSYELQIQALNEEIRSIRQNQTSDKCEKCVENQKTERERQKQTQSLKDYYEKLLNEKIFSIESERQKCLSIQKSKDSQISELQDIYTRKIQQAFDLKEKQIQVISDKHKRQFESLKVQFQRQAQVLKREILIKSASLKQLHDEKMNIESQLMQKLETLKELADRAEQQFMKDRQNFQQIVLNQQKKINQLSQSLLRLKESVNNYEKLEDNSRFQRQKLLNEINQLSKQQQIWNHSKQQLQLMISDTIKQINKLNLRYEKLAFELQQKNNLLSNFENETNRSANVHQQTIQKYEQLIQSLEQKLQQKEKLLEKFQNLSKRSSARKIKEELEQMKKLVQIKQLYRIEAQINQIQNMSEQLMVQMQEKNFLANRISNENLQLKEQLLKEKQITRQLELKLRELQQTHKFFQRQLKNRKQMSEKLITDKISLQKQLLFVKQNAVRFQNKRSGDSKNMVNQIIQRRINALLQIQLSKQRQFLENSNVNVEYEACSF